MATIESDWFVVECAANPEKLSEKPYPMIFPLSSVMAISRDPEDKMYVVILKGDAGSFYVRRETFHALIETTHARKLGPYTLDD